MNCSFQLSAKSDTEIVSFKEGTEGRTEGGDIITFFSGICFSPSNPCHIRWLTTIRPHLLGYSDPLCHVIQPLSVTHCRHLADPLVLLSQTPPRTPPMSLSDPFQRPSGVPSVRARISSQIEKPVRPQSCFRARISGSVLISWEHRKYRFTRGTYNPPQSLALGVWAPRAIGLSRLEKAGRERRCRKVTVGQFPTPVKEKIGLNYLDRVSGASSPFSIRWRISASRDLFSTSNSNFLISRSRCFLFSMVVKS